MKSRKVRVGLVVQECITTTLIGYYSVHIFYFIITLTLILTDLCVGHVAEMGGNAWIL